MKKNKLLMTSWILGAIYVVYLLVHFIGGTASSQGSEQAGAAIATALVMPHIIAVALATLFNILGWAMNGRGFAIAGGVLYCVALILFIPYFLFVLIQIVLSFIGAAKLKQQAHKNLIIDPQ